MKMLFLVLCVALATGSAFAGEINFGDQTKTKYETLLDAYNSTRVPADLTDFPTALDMKRSCVYAGVNKGDVLIEAQIHIVEYLTKAAVKEHDTVGNGPLFPSQHIPGSPAEYVSLLTFGSTDGGTRNTKIDTDFILSLGQNSNYNEVLIRKKDNYFPFIYTYAQSKRTLAAGYCYYSN
jgi:hypothetical protein